MEQLENDIFTTIATQEYMSMSEILAKFPESSKRTVMRKIKKLHKNGLLEHGKIWGKRGHKRYFIKDEKTKNNLQIRAVKIKGKNYKIIHATVTQKNLSSLITQEIKFYEKELKKGNFKSGQDYILYHIALCTNCLRWISQLTWAIHSGLLGDSKNKLDLAKNNRKRYEEFLQKIIYNLKKADEKIMRIVAQALYHVLVDNEIFTQITMGYDKGKISLKINKKGKVIKAKYP